MQAATRTLNRPFRMTEGNSCFHGGKPGVSDTFASSLWCGDYMLQVAQAGYIGVNLHSGGQGYYTPIAGSIDQGFSPRPVLYGALLAQRFAGLTFLETSLSAQSESQNVTAFAAAGSGRHWALAIFNKGVAPVSITVDGLPQSPHISRLRLLGPAIDSRDGVTFGGQTIEPDRNFEPRRENGPTMSHGRVTELLPSYSAVVLEG